MKAGSNMIKKQLERGGPQGSTISPSVWNMFYENLRENLSKLKEVKVHAFADDLCLGVQGRGRKTIQRIVNKAVEVVRKWGEDNMI